ncbi:MAG TPA: alkaline phosphatase, partial [Actinopolymorphaceae bacterium]
LEWNPHLRFYNNLRGYVRTTITPDALTADYRNVGYVSQPGAEAFTRATFVTYDREPGLHQTHNQPAPPLRTRNAPPDYLAAHTIWMETEEYR